MTNRAIDIPDITITVIEISIDWCAFRMKDQRVNPEIHVFLAEDFASRYVLQGMEEGKSYLINQVVKRNARTKWRLATELTRPRYPQDPELDRLRDSKQKQQALLVF